MDYYIEMYSKLIELIEKNKISSIEENNINIEIYDELLLKIYEHLAILLDDKYIDSVK